MKPSLFKYDIEKTRRVCRDLLNKTQKSNDILEVAKILGAKIYFKNENPKQKER